MTRIRIGLVVTIMIGSMYAAAGLLTSLRDFGIGIAVAAFAFLAYGCIDFIEDRRHQNACREAAKEYHPATWWRDV